MTFFITCENETTENTEVAQRTQRGKCILGIKKEEKENLIKVQNF